MIASSLVSCTVIAAVCAQAPATVTRVKPYLPGLAARAQQWQPDARLVGVYIKADSGGELRLTKLALPPNFEGGMLSVNFASKQAGQTKSYTIEPHGTFREAVPIPIYPGQEKSAVGAPKVDFDAALAKAKSQGLTTIPGVANRHLDARLHVVDNAAVWEFTLVDAVQPFNPQVLKKVVVPAGADAAAPPAKAMAKSDDRPPIEPSVAPPAAEPPAAPAYKAPPLKTRTRQNGPFSCVEYFLAKAKKEDMIDYGYGTFSMAVRTGGKADYTDNEMTAERGGSVKLWFRGLQDAGCDRIGDVEFAENGTRVAYYAVRGGVPVVCLGDRTLRLGPEGETRDLSVLHPEIALSPDGQHVAVIGHFVYEKDGDTWEEHRVWLDGEPVAASLKWIVKRRDGSIVAPPFGHGYLKPCFSPNGKRFAYIAATPGAVKSSSTSKQGAGSKTSYTFQPSKKKIVENGKPGAEYEEIRSLQYAATGSLFYLAKSAEGWRLVQDGNPSPKLAGEYSKLEFASDGRTIAATVAERGLFGGFGERLDIFTRAGMRKGGTYDDFEKVAMGRNGTACLAVGKRGKKYVAILDGKDVGEWEFAAFPVVGSDGKRWGLLAKVGDKSYAPIVDGKLGPAGDDVTGMTFSPDGKQCAYVVRKDKEATLYVDGVARHRAPRMDRPVFSADGKRLAYYVWKDPDGYPLVAIDGVVVEGYDRAVQAESITRNSSPQRPLSFTAPNTVGFIGQIGDEYYAVRCTLPTESK